MKFHTIDVQHGQGVAVVWLARPEQRNTINEVMVRELMSAFDRLEADEAVRAVVIAGQGEAFCAGGDLDHMKKMSGASLKENERDAAAHAGLFHRLHTFPKPTVARVHGSAHAGGVGFVCACDIAIASQDAEFRLPEVRVGMAAASMMPQLLRAIGERHASRYLLSSEVFTAAEAYRIGLVQDIVVREELDAAVNRLLGELVRGAPGAQAAAKELIRTVTGAPRTVAQVAGSAKRLAALRAGDEFREGLSALREQRDPAWVPRAARAAKPKRRR